MSDYSIVHVEIASTDPTVASKFYSDLFGWKLQVFPESGYILFQPPSGPIGGFVKANVKMSASFEYKPDTTLVYVSADDIDATLAKAESLGGKILVPKSEIPNFGWFAIFADPTGNHVALYKALG